MADRGIGNVEEPSPVQARDAAAPHATARPGRRAPAPSLWKWLRSRLARRVSTRQVAAFCRQLSILIDVGVPLLQALRKLEQQTTDLNLRHIIHSVGEEIELGGNFSDALANFPEAFTALFISIIKVAERGGVLDESLKLLADELEKREEIRSKIRRALLYPGFIVLIGIFVVFVVLAYVVPTFVDLYAERGVVLPLPTRLLVGFGRLVVGFWWLIILIGIIVIYLVRAFSRTYAGRHLLDRCKLKMWLIGPLLTKGMVAGFAQTLGTLLRGGVPILRALKIVEETSENSVLAETLDRTRENVENGGRLEETLRQADLFPPVAVDMIAVGEEAGRLDSVLFKIAETYKLEVDHSVNNLTTIIEPVLLLFMGLLVALILYSVFLPYFSLPKVF